MSNIRLTILLLVVISIILSCVYTHEVSGTVYAKEIIREGVHVYYYTMIESYSGVLSACESLTYFYNLNPGDHLTFKYKCDYRRPLENVSLSYAYDIIIERGVTE